MKIGIFSKFDMAGGSEFRCIEFANGLVRFTKSEAYILAEKKLPEKLKGFLDPNVKIVEDSVHSVKYFYGMDCILVINTDCKDFSTLDYWLGKSSRHNIAFDIKRLRGKKILFLYNFIVSPSRHLSELTAEGVDAQIITTNSKFFEEITKQDRYEAVRVLPRYILGSPINPELLTIRNRHSNDKKPLVFGMHSKRLGNKWNNEFPELIKQLNERYGEEKITFRFMGIKKDLVKQFEQVQNVVCLQEDEESVKDFLDSLDVFLFFPDWGREEPWARVIAEAMVSGLPIIALNKGGTKDQVLHENNGILCKRFNDYLKAVIYFMEHREMVSKMSRNSIRISKDFYTSAIINKLRGILGD